MAQMRTFSFIKLVLYFTFSLTIVGFKIPTIKLDPDSTISRNGWTGSHISSSEDIEGGELRIFESIVEKPKPKPIKMIDKSVRRTQVNQSKRRILRHFTLNHLKGDKKIHTTYET